MDEFKRSRGPKVFANEWLGNDYNDIDKFWIELLEQVFNIKVILRIKIMLFL